MGGSGQEDVEVGKALFDLSHYVIGGHGNAFDFAGTMGKVEFFGSRFFIEGNMQLDGRVKFSERDFVEKGQAI